MRFVKKSLVIVIFSIPVTGFSQKDSLINKPDNVTIQKDSTDKQINTTPSKKYSENVGLTINSYFILLENNLKQEFAKPFHMKKKDWRNFGGFAATSVALFFADKPVQQAALKLRNRNTGINNISQYVTNFGGPYEVYTLAASGAYSLVFKNEKLKTTTLLATQAYLTSGALATILKYLSGETRPSYYPPGVEAEPRFLGPFHKPLNDADGTKENSSFPSGHATVAFAAATVFASEYKDVPLVPIIAYSAASLIGISRITLNKHWATDVFVGAAIGFLSGKQVVNTYQRYAKLNSHTKKKNSISFNLNYSYGHWEPGMIYKFN